MAENTNTEREALSAYLKDCDAHAIVPDVGGAWHAAFQAGRASLSLPAAGQEPVAWMSRKPSGSTVFAQTKDYYPGSVPVYAAPQPAAPYSIDTDPQGIRATVADAITGALAFGAQGVNQPPEGHWLTPFWDAARADAAPQPAVAAGWVMVPIEPTEEMLANVDQEVGGHCHSCTKWRASYADCKAIWSDMISALPPAPSTEGESNG